MHSTHAPVLAIPSMLPSHKHKAESASWQLHACRMIDIDDIKVALWLHGDAVSMHSSRYSVLPQGVLYRRQLVQRCIYSTRHAVNYGTGARTAYAGKQPAASTIWRRTQVLGVHSVPSTRSCSALRTRRADSTSPTCITWSPKNHALVHHNIGKKTGSRPTESYPTKTMCMLTNVQRSNVKYVPVDGTELGVMRTPDCGCSLSNECKRVAYIRQPESGRWQGGRSVYMYTHIRACCRLLDRAVHNLDDDRTCCRDIRLSDVISRQVMRDKSKSRCTFLVSPLRR